MNLKQPLALVAFLLFGAQANAVIISVEWSGYVSREPVAGTLEGVGLGTRVTGSYFVDYSFPTEPNGSVELTFRTSQHALGPELTRFVIQGLNTWGLSLQIGDHSFTGDSGTAYHSGIMYNPCETAYGPGPSSCETDGSIGADFGAISLGGSALHTSSITLAQFAADPDRLFEALADYRFGPQMGLDLHASSLFGSYRVGRNTANGDYFRATIVDVPEPGVLPLLALGLGAVVIRRRREKTQA